MLTVTLDGFKYRPDYSTFRIRIFLIINIYIYMYIVHNIMQDDMLLCRKCLHKFSISLCAPRTINITTIFRPIVSSIYSRIFEINSSLSHIYICQFPLLYIHTMLIYYLYMTSSR